MDGLKNFPGGTIFPNAGGSHITTQTGGMTHITVDVPGLKQGGNLGIHVPISDIGEVGPPDPFYNQEVPKEPAFAPPPFMQPPFKP
ncbi:MAG: hypothetical protein ACXAE3_17660 [Candidatus Kariarchaeaceae archaeon]|jgi:hypothetical protein